MHPSVADMMSLFEGYKDAYGAYSLKEKDIEVSESGKITGKPYSITGVVDAELWDDHLSGKQGLGIIPINGESKVKFAAIDVDEYPLDLVALNKNIQDNNLPLVLCRTKSGGAHLYLFLNEFQEAKMIQEKMREFAAFLGYGDCEIFPKQVKVLVARGDLGNWINMPYFDHKKTMRYGLGADGKALTIEEFIKFAHTKMITLERLKTIKLTASISSLPDGPPCLQILCKQGFPQGTRNNGLFNLGVYAKKSNPDNVAQLVEEFNRKYMDPPLSPEEVLGVVKSMGKKEYNYTCNTPPIQSYCNQSLCRQMKFGIGGGHIGMPRMGTLSKLDTEPPIWFLDVDGADGKVYRLELSTEDLQKPLNFQRRCMELVNVMPYIPKRENWEAIVGKLLQGCNVIAMPKDSTPTGLLRIHLEDFLTSRVSGKTHEELILGKPWTNNGKHHFRMQDFLKYLERMKFTDFKTNRISMHLRDWGAEKGFFNVKGKGINIWIIPEFKNKQEEPLTPPAQVDDIPY